MLRRVVGKTFSPCSHASIGATFSVVNKTQPFSSNYNDTSRSKMQSHYSSYSGVQHQSGVKKPSVAMTQTVYKGNKETIPTTHRKTHNMGTEEEGWKDDDRSGDHEIASPPRGTKNHYKDLFKPKPQLLSFKSTFSQNDTKVVSEAQFNKQERDNKSLRECHADFEDDEADVTRIYSTDEVQHLIQGSDNKRELTRGKTNKDDVGGLKALETQDERDYIALDRHALEAPSDAVIASSRKGEERAAACVPDYETRDEECVDNEDEADSLASVRQQPFFSDLVRCVEKNMMRYRKEVRHTNRYSRDLINDCVRPLLQLTDFPFTADKLTELTSCINPIVLKRSLSDYTACKRLHIYRSEDTELLLDWSIEDFLRRRYESIHLSWERMDVVYRRFGWNPDIISDRDCLLYFAEFSELVELAELELTADGRPKAISIADPIAQAEERPIPVSKLLIRRRLSADVEPSVTESVRLMGVPAMEDKTLQSNKGYRQYSPNSESVSGMFALVEKAAGEVEGDEAARLAHAADSVRSLKQATHPIGHVVREFSIGKVDETDKSQQQNAFHCQGKSIDGMEGDGAAEQRRSSSNSSPNAYDPDLHESLSNAYHKCKVEVTMLRRRLLSTGNADQAAAIQTQLMNSRKELNCLIDQLRQMRQLKQALRKEQENNKITEDVSNNNTGIGFSIPSEQPDFPEAPEHNLPKNAPAAEDIEDGDDADISKELREFEAEVSASVMNTTTTLSKGEESRPEKMSPKHENQNWRATATIEEEEAQENGDMQDSSVNAVINTVESEEGVSHESSHESSPPLSSSFTHKEENMNDNKMSATSHSEELFQLCEEVSSAAHDARKELEELLHQKSLQEAAMAKQVQEVTNKVSMLEERLDALRRDYQKATEDEAREVAEAKARAAEEELRRQRTIRQAELAKQREQARFAQLQAQKALEQQRAAEEAVLAAERELREMQARFGLAGQHTIAIENTKEGEEFTSDTITVEKSKRALNVAEPSATSALTASKLSSGTEETNVTASTLSSSFTCTPEQYDGMQLAAARLRAEVSSLEKQMEREGEEDDETLMIVLAASRADLEELDACIASVQQHAPWAAERDARRERENRKKVTDGNAELRNAQDQIAQKRFEINLLERRLRYATERSVISKLEQGIIEARRQISRLRIEQDRLRQSGTNEFGLPPSISIAKALADEAKVDAEEVENANDSDALQCPEALAHDASDYEYDAVGEELHDRVGPAAEVTSAALSNADETAPDVGPVAGGRSLAMVPAEERQKFVTIPRGSPLMDVDPETHRLHLRLEGMLRDIQQLQDNIYHQENASSYDDDETEAVLLEMRKKLRQLLQLRDDVQKRLVEAMSGGKTKQDSHTDSVSGDTPPEPPLMASRVTSSIVPSRTKTPSIPLPHLHAEMRRIASSSKRIHRTALKGKERK